MAPRLVLVVAFPGVELLDVAGPVGVFATADRLLRQDGYRVEIAAPAAGPVATAGGVELVARRALARVKGSSIDTILVGGALMPALSEARAVAAHLARLAPGARRVAAVCTGAFLLGEAGLLRGRRAVTHWAACDELRRLHPDCRVDADRIYVRDRRVWTSAGVTAGLDLALALVEQDHGPGLALEVARWLVMYLRRPGGQSQFSAPLAAQRAEHDAVSAVVAWMGENLRGDLSVPALARRASMSVRNFARVFRRETGATPAAFAERLRMEAARRELELTSRSAKQIAAASGFGTVETMHRAFRRSLGTTPLAYRARFALTRQKTNRAARSRPD